MSRSVYEWELAEGAELSLFLFSISLNPLLAGSSNFSRSLFFWEEFCEILKNSWLWRSVIAAWGLAADQSLGDAKNCIVYGLFCIFIIIIIIIINSSSITTSISISCVALLNWPFNPWVSSFMHFSSPSRWGGRRGGSERLSSPSCQLQS